LRAQTQRWESVLAGALRKRGVPRARAASVGTLLIAAIEGAVVLSRAQRATKPLDRVTKELHGIVAGARRGHRY
jgi:transcriptional regulator LmrA/YxaF-like protein